MSWTCDKLWLLLSGSCNNSSSQHEVVTIKYGGLSRGNRGKRFVQIHMQATVACAGNRTPVGLFPVTDLNDNMDQRKNLRSNSDKIVSLPTRIKKEYNGNKRLSSPSSGRNS